jgi:hypothetical protein
MRGFPSRIMLRTRTVFGIRKEGWTDLAAKTADASKEKGKRI